MIGVRRLLALVAVALTVTAGGLVSSAQAAGATSAGPVITWYNCEPGTWRGVSKVVCEITYEGGTAPVTIRWFLRVAPNPFVHEPRFDNQTTADMVCQPGQWIGMEVVLIDVNGFSDSHGQLRLTRCTRLTP